MTDAGLISSGIVAPFLVVLRESIEAALIVGIMWAYLDKTNNKYYQKYLAYGTVGAIVLSLVLGGGIIILLGELAGVWEKTFEGVASITATLVLSYVIIWMAKHAGAMKGELETKIDFAITQQSANSLVFLAFVAVAREGLETVLFLAPLLSINVGQTLLGSVLAVIVALVLSLAAKKQIYALDIGKFFKYTSLILMVFAAGLFGYGLHEMVEAAEIMGIGAVEIIKELMRNSHMVTINDVIEYDLAKLVAANFGYEVQPATNRTDQSRFSISPMEPVHPCWNYWTSFAIYLTSRWSPAMIHPGAGMFDTAVRILAGRWRFWDTSH